MSADDAVESFPRVRLRNVAYEDVRDETVTTVHTPSHVDAWAACFKSLEAVASRVGDAFAVGVWLAERDA